VLAEPPHPPGWLPKAEYDAIFSRVPRLCVEIVIASAGGGVLLTRRQIPPNVGAWHIPGGTVLFGERLVDAVNRVARRELGIDVEVGELLGYIEYPSHYENGLDSPVGLAFACAIAEGSAATRLPAEAEWFTRLPDGLYAEQAAFLATRVSGR
jgi:ADP-ribose pyrophosphatase YjhB (NUDIX family)